MKFTVDVELDWVEEGGTIDEEIKKQIISGISSRINAKSQDEIIKAIQKEISEKTTETVTNKINQMLDDFIGKEVSITDQWGDVKSTIKIGDLIKKKFDSFMTEQVDNDGKPSSYNNKFSRAEWVINKAVREHCDKSVKTIVEDVELKVKEILSQGLELKVKNKLITHLGLEDILNDAKKLK